MKAKKRLVRKDDGGGPGSPVISIANVQKAMDSGWKDASFKDNVANVLVNGKIPSGYTGDQQALLMQAYMWRAQNQGRGPEQVMNSFYKRPIDQSNGADALRGKLNNIGYGPTASYYDSRNADLNKGLFDDGGGVGPGDPKAKTLAPVTVNPDSLIVHDPHDPRLQRYQDSLDMYQYSTDQLKQATDRARQGNYYIRKADSTHLWPHSVFPQGPTQEMYKGRTPIAPVASYVVNTDIPYSRSNEEMGGNGMVDLYRKPITPVAYRPKASAPPYQAPRSLVDQQVQGVSGMLPIQAAPAMSNVTAQQQQTPFSYSGMNRDTGQQQSVYFPDLDSWKGFVQQQGAAVMNSSTTNNDKQANATGYFKQGGMKKLTKADLGMDIASIQGTPQIYAPAPGQAPNIMSVGNASQPQTDPSNPGINVNWNHVMGSYMAQSVVSGLVDRFSPNSQQNTIQQFNKQQFSPMNYLPETPNNSLQARYGVGYMAEGGYVDATSMRDWILGSDDTPAPSVQEEPQQAPQQNPYDDDAAQFARFVQMMGLDQADAEKEPEDEDEGWMYAGGGPVTDGELYEILGDEVDDDSLEHLAKGGWIQKANASIKKRGTKGVCTGSKFGGPSCRAGTRRYALAKTFKHMAKHRKHEDGGPVGPDKPIVSTTAHNIPSPNLPFRTNGQVVNPSYGFIPQGATKNDSTQYRQGFYDVLGRMNAGKLHPFDEAAYYWSQINGQTANVRYPGVDVPGRSDAFNSGAREGYINMPEGSYQFKGKGGNVYSKGGSYDLSPETIIGLIGKGYQFDV